jgi:hypothetical protein
VPDDHLSLKMAMATPCCSTGGDNTVDVRQILKRFDISRSTRERRFVGFNATACATVDVRAKTILHGMNAVKLIYVLT